MFFLKNAGSIDVKHLPVNKGNLTVFQLVDVSSPLSTAVLQEFRQKHMPHITRNITVTALFKTKAFLYNVSVLFRIEVAYYKLLLNIVCVSRQRQH